MLFWPYEADSDMIEPFAPPASNYAHQLDWLLYALVGLSSVIVLFVLVAIIGFSIRYRKGSSADRGHLPRKLHRYLEFGWTSGTAIVFLFIFWLAAVEQLHHFVPPKHALEVHVIAKQWMWKVQQPNGVREINELHAPIGQPVLLVMTSEDVIHSMFLPALRLKQDVLPGRYLYLWFNADKVGIYHLLCTQFCGTGHSRMVGRLVLMAPEDYSRWSAAQPEADNLALQGEKLFNSLGCSGCHAPQSGVHCPDLHGVYGRPVQLWDGRAITADEAYIHDKILFPNQDVPAGYEPIMPSFRGVVNEEQILKLVAYVRSLSNEVEGQ